MENPELFRIRLKTFATLTGKEYQTLRSLEMVGIYALHLMTALRKSGIYTRFSFRLLSTRSSPASYSNSFFKGEILQTLRGHHSYVVSCDFSPSGTLLATASTDASVFLWDLTKGTRIGKLSSSNYPMTSVTFGRNGEHILTGSYDGFWYFIRCFASSSHLSLLRL
jgi:WD40 repeat protein